LGTGKWKNLNFADWFISGKFRLAWDGGETKLLRQHLANSAYCVGFLCVGFFHYVFMRKMGMKGIVVWPKDHLL